MLSFRFLGCLVGLWLLLDGLALAQPARDIPLERPCVFMVRTGGGTSRLEPMCPNNYGGQWIIEAVSCWSTTGQVTVLPQLHGAGATSVIPTPLQCGAKVLKGVKTKGNPTVNILADDAARCPTEPCYLDVTITAPPASGEHEATITIVGKLVLGAK